MSMRSSAIPTTTETRRINGSCAGKKRNEVTLFDPGVARASLLILEYVQKATPFLLIECGRAVKKGVKLKQTCRIKGGGSGPHLKKGGGTGPAKGVGGLKRLL